MRKTTALLSATTLGVVAVAAGVAAPASADMITDPRCETFEDHLDGLTVEDPEADWYMECVPQYGMGKAEFTVEAPDSGFPEGFDIMTAARVDAPDASGVAPYYEGFFGDTESPLDGWITPIEVDEETSTETSLRVGALLVAPVTSVGRPEDAPTDVLAACEVGEDDESVTFVSTFAPVSSTFSFVGSDGVTYTAPVTATPGPTYYTFITTVDETETVQSLICITDLHQTVVEDTDGGIGAAFAGLISVPPYVWFDSITGDFDSLPSLGSVQFAGPTVDPGEPELAATGADDVLPLGIAAGVLGGLGALLFALSRRRRPQE